MYALWLDLRTTDDALPHGSGRKVDGVTIQITMQAKASGLLNVYLYIIMDVQLNIEDDRFVSAII